MRLHVMFLTLGMVEQVANGGSADGLVPATTPKAVSSRRAEVVEGDRLTWTERLFEPPPLFVTKIEPTSRIKLRKLFRFKDYPATKVSIGGDFNTQSGKPQFVSSVANENINAKVGVTGREFYVSKWWLVGFAENEALRARLRLKFAVDMLSGETYCRFGFRTEEDPYLKGLFRNSIPLETKLLIDKSSGPGEGHAFLELKGHVAVPAPLAEFRYDPGRERGAQRQPFTIDAGVGAASLDEVNFLLQF